MLFLEFDLTSFYILYNYTRGIIIHHLLQATITSNLTSFGVDIQKTPINS